MIYVIGLAVEILGDIPAIGKWEVAVVLLLLLMMRVLLLLLLLMMMMLLLLLLGSQVVGMQMMLRLRCGLLQIRHFSFVSRCVLWLV